MQFTLLLACTGALQVSLREKNSYCQNSHYGRSQQQWIAAKDQKVGKCSRKMVWFEVVTRA
uniref:Secreted protein n=1 Tax=Arundo donax TaxID=35708 RepID=A0A0A9GLP8_ARUDO